MRALFSVAVLYVAALMQMMLGPQLAVYGVEPDLVFATVVALSAVYGFLGGALAGAGVGFYLDLLFLCPGFYSLQYILSGAVAGLVSGGGERKSRVVQALLAGLSACFVKELSILLSMYLERIVFDWWAILQKVLVGAVYTTLWTLALYFIVQLFFGKIHIKRRKAGRAI